MTTEKMRSLGMPMYCAASGSCEMARIAEPSRVRWMKSHSAPITDDADAQREQPLRRRRRRRRW